MVRLRRRKLFLSLLAKLVPDFPPSEFRLSSLLAPLPLLGLNQVEIFSESFPERNTSKKFKICFQYRIKGFQ
jgi:hypothetical protein